MSHGRAVSCVLFNILGNNYGYLLGKEYTAIAVIEEIFFYGFARSM